MTPQRVTGVVLAAGRSTRLGRPKQLLQYRDTTVLGAALEVASSAGFDQLIVTLGDAADAVCDQVPLHGADVVALRDFGAEFGTDLATGCSASLRVALTRVDPEAAGIVLLLGDQPQMDPATVRRMIQQGPAGDIMVCRYDDGIGHPFWFARNIFSEISQLHGDKGVWRLIESGRHAVRELVVDGPVPLDVDTWEDYHRLLETPS